MSLINSSYFIGPISIAQAGKAITDDIIQGYIDRSEQQFLASALGYDLSQAFIAGLAESVIDQKWLDLRDGIQFMSQGGFGAFPGYFPMRYYGSYYFSTKRNVKWVGFANSTVYAGNPQSGPQIDLITGSGANNPVTGTNTFTLSALAGATYTIERRGFGTLLKDVDYSLSNNNQTITLIRFGDVFGAGEIFIIHLSTVVSSAAINPGTSLSPIAKYVWYEYQKQMISLTTGVGISKAKAENTVNANPHFKMIDVWNSMCDDIFILWQFLKLQGTDVYSDYNPQEIDCQLFYPQNVFQL